LKIAGAIIIMNYWKKASEKNPHSLRAIPAVPPMQNYWKGAFFRIREGEGVALEKRGVENRTS